MIRRCISGCFEKTPHFDQFPGADLLDMLEDLHMKKGEICARGDLGLHWVRWCKRSRYVEKTCL